MSKDFAQRGGGGRQASASRAPGWLWLFIGIAVGAAGAAGYYITRPTDGAGDAREAAADKDKPGARKKIKVPPATPSRFDFYTSLPKYELVVPRDWTKPKPAPGAAPADTGDLFLIQVGSFKARSEADQLKAKVALLGIESRIEQVTINNAETWYRVRIGPVIASRRDAMLPQLQDAGLSGYVTPVQPAEASR